MDIRPIRTEADYDAALKEIEAYFEGEPEPGSPEADRFDVPVIGWLGAPTGGPAMTVTRLSLRGAPGRRNLAPDAPSGAAD